MTGACHGCGNKAILEPFSSLCLECLIASAKAFKRLREHERVPFDPKAAAAGKDDE